MNKIQQIEEVVRKECWWLEEYEDQSEEIINFLHNIICKK